MRKVFITAMLLQELLDEMHGSSIFKRKVKFHIKALQKELDSMRIFHRESNQPKVYPFNPNFITDFKGYKLGMSTEEIDRLLDYRKKNKWLNKEI